MSRKNPARAAKRTKSRLQAFLLLILGVFCVLAAWLLHPNPYAYPVGILVLGLGMLLAAALNPYRLVIGGILTALIGMAVFLSFKPVIPVLSAYPNNLIVFDHGKRVPPSYSHAISVRLYELPCQRRSRCIQELPAAREPL